MDVEDPINPDADDAALHVAHVFTEAGVRGSFCLTGEKIRTLTARGRQDVLNAYEPHCLGLHTDTHSFHPTTMELLADLEYAEGCKAAFESQQPAEIAFNKAFGRKPAFWGGAGNTWSPEISDTLKRLDIPAYSYALTEFPNHAVHRFNGVLALPQATAISESEWADDEKASAAMDRVLTFLDNAVAPWIGLFIGHPTRLRHVDYWDTPYFAGRTPPSPEYTQPLPVETYRRSLKNLGSFLQRLQQTHRIVGVDEILTRDWQFEPPTPEERAYFEKQTAANLRIAAGWPPHRPGLSADKIVAKTLALADTAEIARA